MSFGIALATGFIKESTLKAKEKAAARAATAASAAEYANFVRQENYKAGLTRSENATQNRVAIETSRRSDVSVALQKGLEDGTLTPAGIQAIGSGITSLNPAWFDLSKTADAIANAGNFEKYTGLTTDYKLKLAGDESTYGKSSYDQSRIFWDSWNAQLSTEQGFDAAVNFFQNNEDARERLRSNVAKNELSLRVGFRNSQTKGVDGAVTAVEPFNLAENYGAASRLFDALGFENVEEQTIQEIGREVYELEDDEQAIMLTTQDTSVGGVLGGIVVPMKKATVSNLQAMASRAGYNTVQQFVSTFGYRAGERPEDMSDEDFARQQNDVLIKAARLEQKGYGNMLANPALMTLEDSQKLYTDLQTTFQGDKKAIVQAMSLLVGTPEGVLTKKTKFRYSSNANQKFQVEGGSAAFVKSVTGLDVDDFNDGLKAQEDAVAYIDRLIGLEADIGEKVGTGWVRNVQAIVKTIGIQFEQGVTSAGALFDANADFAATADGTTQRDLQATITRVNESLSPENRIDLANISEAEAIRLTLAAKMARAVDPSGRLSNQDFEIQLRRLGEKNFSTPQSIRAALQLVRKEFNVDLEFKKMLQNVLDDKTPLTPQVARTVQAHMRLRSMEGNLFGAKGVDTVVQSADSSGATGAETGSVTATLSKRTLNGNPLYIVKGGPNDGLYSTDEQGTQVVPDDQIGNIK